MCHMALPQGPGRCLAWHIGLLQRTLQFTTCEQLVIPYDVMKCSNPHCLAHRELLYSICHELVQCLLTSAEATIPQAKFKKGVAGWNGEVCPLREKFWSRLWKENGCPQVGVLSQLWKYAKSWYRYAGGC